MQRSFLASPNRHRIPLDELVGVLAASAFLRERDQKPLRANEPAEPVEILHHVLGIDQQFLDEAGEAVQREVKRHRRVRRHHPLGRGVRDIALMPQHDILHGRCHIGANHARETGEILR